MIERLVLDIGGVLCEVCLQPPLQSAALVARYAEFLTVAVPDWQIELRYDPLLIDEGVDTVTYTGAVTQFRYATFAGSIDLDAQRAVVSMVDEASADAVLERIMSHICMQLLPRQHHALWLHAAGLVWGGNGYAFFGPSHAGKTTLSRLARGRAEILSDENVIVRCGAAGPQLISTPFWGHRDPLAAIQRVRRTVPLRALFALRHTPDFQVRRLSAAEAVLVLLATEKVPAERVESAAAWLGAAEQLVQQVPIYELGFAPTPVVWEFLEERGLLSPERSDLKGL